MGKPARKKSVSLQLVAAFESIFFKSFLPSDTVPDITQIEKILEENKNNLDFYKELINFFKFIEEDRTDFFIDGKINNLLISGKSKEVLENSLKKLAKLIQDHEDKQGDSHDKTTLDLTDLPIVLVSTIKNAVKKNVKSFGQLFYLLANNPVSSLKKSSLFWVYALAGQPVAGLHLSSALSSARYIDNMVSSQESEWFKFFDRIKEMLVEYNNYSMDKNKKRIFFKFLNVAFSGDSARRLNERSKESLFRIAYNELNNRFNDYHYNDISDLETLHRLFDIFLRIKHSENWYETILTLVSQYAEAIVKRQIVVDGKIENLDRHLTDFFWVLNANFNWYVKENLSELKFKDFFNSLQKMNYEIYRWDQNSIFSFRTVLSIHYRLRSTFHESTEICNYLDQSVQDYVKKILDLTENQCFFLSKTEIKECTYIEYVRTLTEDKKHLFTEISQPVEKTTVFPNSYEYKTPDKSFTIMVSYQHLTDNEKEIINQAILNTYIRVEDLKRKLNLFAKPLTSRAFILHIFSSNEQYIKYGPLWGVNTAGGGYAHVRSPSESELPSDYFRQRTEGDSWYETFVYQQEGDVRNGKDKEGGSFRNLGHEIQHTLFYALVGEHKLHNLPSWMIEGGANALGNEACFKEEADYIKGFKDKFPSIERIINMSYVSGGDLYYFGSALFRFMLEKHPNLLREAIIKAQNETEIHEINQFIKDSFTLTLHEQEFNSWITDDCPAEINKDNPNNTEYLWQDLYRQDLQNSPRLSNFIQQYGPIEFMFSDTVFVLSADQLFRHNTDPAKTAQSFSLDDYQWFKSALEIYISKNRLTKLSSETIDDNILIQELVNIKGHDFANREVKNIKIESGQREELNFALENFVLQKSFLSKNLKQRFQQVGEINSTTLAFILRKMADAPSTCAAYLKTRVNQAPSPQLNYLEDLKNNLKLADFILQHGSIEFTFSDTVFALSESQLSRHRTDRAKTPQSLSLHDYKWFKEALGIYVIKNKLLAFKQNNTDAEIAKLIHRDEDYIDNRRVVEITPEPDKIFQSLIENLISQPNFGLSDHLKKALDKLSQSVGSNTLSTLGQELSTVDTRPITLNPLLSPLAITTLASNISLLLNTTSNLPALTSDEPTSKDDFNFYNWQLPVIASSLALTAAVLTGVSFWCYNRKKITDKNKDLEKDESKEYFLSAEHNTSNNGADYPLTSHASNGLRYAEEAPPLLGKMKKIRFYDLNPPSTEQELQEPSVPAHKTGSVVTL
jgi:hypothetical protein